MRWGLPRNPVSGLGVAITSASALLFLALAFSPLAGVENPYFGLVIFLALPATFVLGLLLIPIGALWARRREARGKLAFPRLDLGEPTQRRILAFIGVMTLVNIGILSAASYGAVHYMESESFCGQLCHTVMEPEYVAYLNAPHARVACTDCHVGSGATYFVRAKLAGTRQLLSVMTDSYERPIPAPVRTLRPARDTCERCHWPEKFHGEKIKVIHDYAEDEANTESVTTLTLHVGGGSEQLGVATGIHWHMNLSNEIEYIATDAARQEIPYVRLRDRNGVVKEYVVEGVSAETLAGGERRRMDCMDCHNRPSHTFDGSPVRAVNGAIAIGRLDRSLPYIRREAVAALAGNHGEGDVAASVESIAERLRTFYEREYPEHAASEPLARAIRVTQDLYRQNVFPAMGVTWSTYPNELGHTDAPGCFRCHDDNHRAGDGSVIRQDCDVCHTVE